MSQTSVGALTLLVLFGLTDRTDAQAQSSETARKHLDSGVRFYEQGQYKQALSDFEIVVSMNDPTYADDALLKIGEYYLQIEEGFEKAREYFGRVLQDYPTSDAAPGAYYYIGLVTMRSSIGDSGLDDAIANFERVIRLYPDSAWVPAALHAHARAMARKGAWEGASGSYFRVVSEYPHSPWAARSQLELGRCSVRLGDPEQGMIEIQRVREQYPGTDAATEALGSLTHLFRLYGYPELGRPISFRSDPSFRPGLKDELKDVGAVKISPEGIHVLERGRKRVLTFDSNGKLQTTKAVADPRGLSVDPRAMMVVANEKGLLIGDRPLVLNIPDEKESKPLERVRAAVRDRLGDIYVYDDNEKKILRFDSEGQLKGSFPDGTRREILRLELDDNGNVILLGKKDRSVEVFSSDGRRIAHIERRGEKWDLEEPTDIAVDPAGYFYLLDQKRPQVAVFDPSYRFVTLLTAQNLGGGILGKPIALDVDSSGDIYAYDDDTDTLHRLH